MLPGSGSDAAFVRAAFGPALDAVDIRLHTPEPRRGADVVAGYAADLAAAAAAADGPMLVGGVSLGAQVTARWVARRPRPFVAGLLLALPAWRGPPGGAPAARAAAATAALVRASGVAAAVEQARAGAPRWLADELARAWPGYGPALADALLAAAAEPGPTDADLRGIGLPTGIVGVTGDAVHPIAEARAWHDRVPGAALVTSTLDAVGADPAVLGRAAVLAWLRSVTGHQDGD